MSLIDRLANTLYNLDRAIASLGGAPPQETISSMLGRIETGEIIPTTEAETLVAHLLGALINLIDPGHTIRAKLRADTLDAADTGQGAP